MTWTQSEITDTWTHDGTTTDAVVAARPLPSLGSIKVQVADIDHFVGVRVLGSDDLRTCYEVIRVAANFVIRKVTFGVAGASLVTSAHGMSAGQAYNMGVQSVNGEIRVYLDGTRVTALTYQTDGDLADYDQCGFASAIDGAVVLHSEVCNLKAQVEPRADILLCIVAGYLYQVRFKNGVQTVSKVGSSRVTDSDSRPMMAVLGQTVYIVDGKNAQKYDPTTETVSKWTPTAGTLPGQTADGTTTATIIHTHRSRIFLAGVGSDPQNLFASAINDGDDWDTGAVTPGKAFVLGGSGGANAGKVGQPIVGLQTASSTALVIACTGETWQLLGDPALGAIETVPSIKDHGGSGPKSMWLLAGGVVAMHGPEAVFLIPQASLGLDLSGDNTTVGLDFPRDESDEYAVQVIYDPSKSGMHIFRTRFDASETVHWWYSDRIGEFKSGKGGFFPESWRTDLDPMCSVIWQGRVVMGCRDGFIREFDDTVKGNDDGVAIESRCALSLMHNKASSTKDTILVQSHAVLGACSDVSVRVWGGRTAEEAYGVNE